jgi:signal peptidase II
VFDFMNVGLGRLRTGVFNVADMSITFGVLWFLYLAFRDRDKAAPGEGDSGNGNPVEA